MGIMKNHLTIGLFLLTGLLCNVAYADQALTDVNLLVEGKALISKSDMARAREAAVKNAQEKAVLQIAEKILADKYSDEKFQAVKSILIGKADQYVKNYRIASEGNNLDEYIVGVNMVVSQGAVREELIQMGVLAGAEKPKRQAVSVHLQGIKKYSDFIQMKSFLQNQSKVVKSVYPCALEFQKAMCELVIVGDVKSLMAELEKEGRYSVEENRQNPNAVSINLRMREDMQ